MLLTRRSPKLLFGSLKYDCPTRSRLNPIVVVRLSTFFDSQGSTKKLEELRRKVRVLQGLQSVINLFELSIILV